VEDRELHYLTSTGSCKRLQYKPIQPREGPLRGFRRELRFLRPANRC